MKRLQKSLGIVTSPIVLLILLAMATPAAYGRLESAFPSSTPTPGAESSRDSGFLHDATVIEDTDLRRYVWDANADVTGDPSLTPVSLTVMVDSDGMWLVGELRNDTASYRTVPSLAIEATTRGTSLGEQEVQSAQRFVAPGQSAFYAELVYPGMVQSGTWDLVDVWSGSSHAIGDPTILPRLSLSVDEQRIYNDGTVEVGTTAPIALRVVARDAQGHFVGYCTSSDIEARIPAGASVPLPESPSPASPDACDRLPRDLASGLGTMPLGIGDYLVIP